MTKKNSKKMKIAIAAWEIGRASSGLGTKIGGLGVIIEELPSELIKAAAKQDIQLEIEILSPCFAHFSKNQLSKMDLHVPVKIRNRTFDIKVYQHVFPDDQKVIYFEDDWQLSWTDARHIYPNDPQVALLLYATINQAMAGYIKQGNFDTIHLHDYHVGLIPFYLGDEYLKKVPIHFTIHNATYQGITPLVNGGYASIDQINLPGSKLFHKYFDSFDKLNLMKACMLKVHEHGGKITTVSGDLSGTWGYAAELKENYDTIWHKASLQKGASAGEVFVPNGGLDLFEKLPISGITNGMGEGNRPENLPELNAKVLKEIQKKQGIDHPIFKNPITQAEMLASNHNFDASRLQIKSVLKRLLHLEAFHTELTPNTILLTVVGRLVEQKNLKLVSYIIEDTLEYDPDSKFIILASAPEGDRQGKKSETDFFRLSAQYPDRIYFDNTFNQPFSRLIFAGGDFFLIPSRFEPCGLVDYEASLLGNVVIARATGGLTKVKNCAYLYEWLDISDQIGEAKAFLEQIKAAIYTYRYYPNRHKRLIHKAMAVDSGWDASAAQYINMYRYGLLVKKWQTERQALLQRFSKNLRNENRELFSEFFAPALQEYGDQFDWELKKILAVNK